MRRLLVVIALIAISAQADRLNFNDRFRIVTPGDPQFSPDEADAASMPFAAAAFDLITSNLGINNFENPALVIRECGRVARPGARIAMTTNVTGHMAGMYDLLRTVAPDRRGEIDEQERHRGTLATVTALMTGGGFEVTRHVSRELALTFAGGTKMLHHSLVKWFLDGWRGAVGSDRELWAEVERQLNARGPLRFEVPMLYIEGVRR